MSKVYEITVKGWLDETWQDWFGEWKMEHRAGPTTRLTGTVPDQAALFGVLTKLRNLGLELLLVRQQEVKELGAGARPLDPNE